MKRSDEHQFLYETTVEADVTDCPPVFVKDIAEDKQGGTAGAPGLGGNLLGVLGVVLLPLCQANILIESRFLILLLLLLM